MASKVLAEFCSMMLVLISGTESILQPPCHNASFSVGTILLICTVTWHQPLMSCTVPLTTSLSFMSYRSAVLLNLGSGKGKALIAASRYPFKSLQGVELSARINAIACANLKRLALDKRVDLFEGAAADYSFQPHERIIYFFNSFSGDALHSLLNNLAASPRIGPGVLIYTNPTERSDVEKYFPCIHHEFTDPGHCEVSYHRLPASS